MIKTSDKKVAVVGGGLAGSEAALYLAERGVRVVIFEMRGKIQTPVHKTNKFAELVCSNSLKSEKIVSAAGLLKKELDILKSNLYKIALNTRVAAGGALAVDRDAFSSLVTKKIKFHPLIEIKNVEVENLNALLGFDAIILSTGPMTTDKLANYVKEKVGEDYFHFFDAAAPIVMADSLDFNVLFAQNRYENDSDNVGDYLNAPLNREEYENFINELVSAKRVVLRSFETGELFSACQPIEEIAKKGFDAPRFGALKPVGLTDPKTRRRPWAVVQLRAENKEKTAYNLVGFQTNLTFSEQKRVFRMIPGLESVEFARYGVIHKNLFINAPKLLNGNLRCEALTLNDKTPVFVAGQFAGTEGYCEAIRSGLHVAISTKCYLDNIEAPKLPKETVFGALLSYATDIGTKDYQPMHVNFGIIPPLSEMIKNKEKRYEAYAKRADEKLKSYVEELHSLGI